MRQRGGRGSSRLTTSSGATAPATLNQLAAPVATALQLAMFGHFLPTAAVAAWIAIGATVQFVASLTNFLLVVSMARVSHALGAEAAAAETGEQLG